MNDMQLGGEGEGRKWKVVYTIVEAQGRNTNPERKYWLRIGIAFVNRDGSLNVRLDAMPVNGTLHIRDQSPDGLLNECAGAGIAVEIRVAA